LPFTQKLKKESVARDGPQMAWHTRNACWIRKARNTHTQVV